MAEVFLSPERPVTCAEFRDWWDQLAPEQQFQLACGLMDMAQASRVLHREYFSGTHRGEAQHYDAINQSEWPVAEKKWRELGFALENVFGSAVSSWSPAPPLILLNASNAIRRCNVAKTEPAKPLVVEKPPAPVAKDSVHYEVFVKPESGPAVVSERDARGNWAWVDKQEAISVAASKKTSYPHMDFIVHEVLNAHGPRTKVYDTSEPPAV